MAWCFSDENAGPEFHALCRSDGRIVSLDHAIRLRQLGENLRNRLPVQVHRLRQGLEHEDFAVAIHDDAGQAVALTPHNPQQIPATTGFLPVFQRLRDPPVEKIRVQILPAPGEPPHDNLRLRVVNPDAQQLVPSVLDRHDTPVLGASECFQNFTGINPVMPVQDPRARADDDSSHSVQAGRSSS